MNNKNLAFGKIAFGFLTGVIVTLNIYAKEAAKEHDEKNISEVEIDKIEVVSEEEKKKNYIADLKKAAISGDAEAQYKLGECYYRGYIQYDEKKWLYWLQKSADQNYADALYELGILHYTGRFVEKNFKKAFEYLQKAAQQNHVGATHQLGQCYFEGNGVEKNINEALKLFRIAADQGDVYSQYSLGLAYFNGIHVTKNYDTAVKYFKLAADQWHEDANYYLGLCYENGWGVEKNLEEAIHCYRAAVNDSNDAKEKINAYKIKSVEKYLQGVEFIYQPIVESEDENGFSKLEKMCNITFVKDGKVLLNIKSVNNLRFMEELYAHRKYGTRKVTLEYQDLNDKNFDYRTMLHDVHGKLDYRYLFIGDFHSGTAATGHKAYIVDVKDNFKLIATVEAGEIMVYPYCMQQFTSWKTVMCLGYFGVNGYASVDFLVIHEDGKEKIKLPNKMEFTQEQIIKMLGELQAVFDRNINWYREAAISFLYANLIQTGNFHLGPKLALKIGYTKEEVDKFHAEILQEIKSSNYKAELCKLNNIEL